MTIIILLIQKILQLFAIMLMGYVIVKAGKLRSEDSKIISVLFVYLVVPCCILNAFQIDYTPEIGKGLAMAFLAAALAHVVFLGVTLLIRKPLGLDVIERETAIYSNAGILVIPLVQEILGQEYVIYTSAFIAVQLVILWTHGRIIMSRGAAIRWQDIILNVNIISITVGMILFALHINFPAPVQGTLTMVGDMMGPLGMMISGMTIASIPVRTVFTTARNYVATVLRIVVYPLIMLPVMKALVSMSSLADIKPILLTVYIACITPACATVTSMAQLYDEEDAPHASALYVLSTLLSIITMPILVGLYEILI